MLRAVNEKYWESGLGVEHRKAEADLFICYTCSYTDRSKKGLEEHIAASNCNSKTHMKRSTAANEYVCTQCNSVFLSKINLYNHVIKMHSEQAASLFRKLYECSVCNYKTARKSNFDRHTSIHSSDRKIYSCTHCNATYTSKQKLNDHILRKHPNHITSITHKVHECSECPYKTVKRNLLDKHIMSVHPDTASSSTFKKCMYCDATFKWSYNLDDHIVKKHPNYMTSVTHKIHECSECSYKTAKKSLFDNHMMSVHPNSASSSTFNKCMYCDATFNWTFSLDDHIVKKHPNHIASVTRKIHKCSECTYKTVIKGHLDSHVVSVHRDEADDSAFSRCLHCDATFRKRQSLDNHVIKNHPNFIASVTRKIHQCPSCTYKTTVSTFLKRHLLVHSGAPSKHKLSSTCMYCNATFSDNMTLDNHILKKHPNYMSSVTRKVHECPQCTYKTIKKSHLDGHMSIHSDAPSSFKFVTCIHCNATFKKKDALDDHILKKHPAHIASVTSIVHECSQCTYKTVKKCNLDGHIMSIHPDASSSLKISTCMHCNATFKKKQSLDEHIIRNHPDFIASVTRQIYQCPNCPYKSTVKTLLDCHLLVHRNITSKRKACMECNAIFRDKITLDSHIMKNHPNSMDSVTRKVYQCSECEYKTVRRSHLDTHITSIHSSSAATTKPNICIHCNASFKRSLTLDDHILREHPDFIASIRRKIHQCPNCTYKTTCPAYLNRHLLVHAGADKQ